MFPDFAFMHKTAMNSLVQVFWGHVFISFQHIPRMERVGFWTYVCLPSVEMTKWFHKMIISPGTHQRCMREPVTLYSRQHLVFPGFVILATLVAGTVVFHCGFKLHFPGDIQHWATFYMFIGQLDNLFLKFRSLPFNCCLYYLLVCRDSWYILDMSLLSHICVCVYGKYFLPVSWLFTLLIVLNF